MGLPRGHDQVEGPESFICMLEGEPQQRPRDGLVPVGAPAVPVRADGLEGAGTGVIPGRADRQVPRAVGGAEPEPPGGQPQTAAQHLHDLRDGVFRREAAGENLGHVREDAESGRCGIEERRGHRPLT